MQLIDEKQIVLRGIIINYLQLFVAFVSNFILTPVILNHLGQAAYGLWAIFSSIMFYFLLFDLGMNTAIAKYTAEYHAIDMQERINKIVSTTFMLFLFIACLIVLISFVLMHFIPGIFKISDYLAAAGKTTFLIMGVNVAISVIGGVFGNVLYGYQRIDIWKLCSITQLITNALLVVLFLKSGFGLIGLSVASTLSTLLLLSLYVLFIYYGKYGVVIAPRLFEFKVFKEIAPYSIRTFVLGISSRVLYYTGPIIIGIFLGTIQVAAYDVTYKLCFYATYVFSIISATFFPKFSRAFALGDIDRLRDLFLMVTKISLAMGTAVSIFIFFCGHSFIALWVGEANFAGTNVLVLLLLMNFFHALGTPVVALLQGIGKNEGVAYSEMVNAGLNIILSVLLIKWLGLPGVVLATLIAHICTSFWVIQISAMKSAKLHFKEYILKAIWPPLFSGIISGGLLWMAMRSLFQVKSFIYLAFNGIIVMVSYGIVYFVIGSTKEERLMYYRLFKGA